MMAGAALTARIDRRVLRTRGAIVGAFRRLILDQGYDALSVDDVDDKGRRLLALQLAGGQLAAIDDWLAGRLAVSLDVLADTLRKVAHASAGAHRPD